MELVHLECFVALADELHFGRAAARLHMGTSSMSKRIAELERSLGVRLFDRTSRDVRLTAGGEVLLSQASRTLGDVATLRAMAADAAAGTAGAVRAAYSPGTGELMTVLVRELRRRSPDVTVHPVQMLSVRVAAAVRSEAVVVGIARVAPGPDLATMVLVESPNNVVALPATHPLAARSELSVEDLSDENILVPSPSVIGGGLRIPLARSREAEVTTESELFDMVAGGLGLIITTEGVIRRNPRLDIVGRPLHGYNVIAKDLLIWRPDNDSPILRLIREVAAELRPHLDHRTLG